MGGRPRPDEPPSLVTGTVVNRGNSTSSSIRLGFYLSSDAVINFNDLLIGTCNFPSGISTAQSGSCTAALNVPAGIGAGTYFLGAIVDDSMNEADSGQSM